MTSASFINLAVAVSDLQRSLDFYCGALGFAKATASYAIGKPVAELVEIPEVELAGHFIRNGDLQIELFSFRRPGITGSREERVLNHRGGVHLAFAVDDVALTAAKIRQLGGSVHENTKTDLDLGGDRPCQLLYCFDPDGVRIELISNPGATPDYK